MKILVTYATRHGATRGIAERIAATLERRGLDVTLESVDRVRDIGAHDAFGVGSATYAFHWLGAARDFVRRNSSVLASRPVWLFSSGPLGTETVDAEGRDARVAAEPKEFAELRETLHPRDARVFFGAYDPATKPIGLMERAMRAIPAARDALPAGDFRDWSDIEAWADGIAEALVHASAGAPA